MSREEKSKRHLRKDPTFFLPEEPMTYEIKKKKKKKHKQEDPFKDIGVPGLEISNIIPAEPTLAIAEAVDPEVNIKVENIEVELDFNDFANANGLMVEGPQSEESQEPEVKIEQENREAAILTFEHIVSETKEVLGYKGGDEQSLNQVCNICHLVFQTHKTLLMHQKRKHKAFRRAFKHICDYCGMSYEQKNSLVAHIKRKHGPESNPDDFEEKVCEVCALVFKGITRLRMHMRRKHGSFEDSFKHVCNHCGLTYDKYRSLIVHVQRKHTFTKKPSLNQWFNCPFCPKIFSKRETYARHIQRKHKVNDDEELKDENSTDNMLLTTYKDELTGELTCKECPLVFSNLTFLKLHMRRKHNALREDFRLKCRICNLSYDKIESLKRHVRRKHNKGAPEVFPSHNTRVRMINECKLCGLIFASPGGLAKHLRCTHKLDTPKTIFCTICNEGFHDKRQLKMHYMRVHLKISYTCTHCNKPFKAKESFRRHMLIKHPSCETAKIEPQKCEQCPETFIDEFELCRHINMVHSKVSSDPGDHKLFEVKKEDDELGDQFHCTKCPETYDTWENLKLHYEQNHYMVEESQCQMCGEILPLNELTKHIKTYHTDNDFQCKYCEFQTTYKVSMTQHLLRHKNAMTLHCDYPACRYKTFYESAMKKHKQKHVDQGVKLQCGQCPFQTMNKYILRYHEEAHATGKKRYACDQCDYATILPANLVQHKYKHSSEKRFKCEVCSFATKYNTSLRFHVKKKHCDLPSFS